MSKKIIVTILLMICFLFQFELSAKAGDYKNIGSGWSNVGGMASLDGKLYIISGGILYETGKDGKYKNIGSGWSEIGGMASLDGKLYIISGGILYMTESK